MYQPLLTIPINLIEGFATRFIILKVLQLAHSYILTKYLHRLRKIKNIADAYC